MVNGVPLACPKCWMLRSMSSCSITSGTRSVRQYSSDELHSFGGVLASSGIFNSVMPADVFLLRSVDIFL